MEIITSALIGWMEVDRKVKQFFRSPLKKQISYAYVGVGMAGFYASVKYAPLDLSSALGMGCQALSLLFAALVIRGIVAHEERPGIPGRLKSAAGPGNFALVGFLVMAYLKLTHKLP